MEATQARVLGPKDGRAGSIGLLGVRFMVAGEDSAGGFSLVEHPLAPHALGAPMHRHAREDEYSFILEGEVTAQLGEETVVARPGDFVFKPRGQWHAFWNAGDEPARFLEIISPAGFEKYFEELTELPPGAPDPARIAEIAARYELELDFASIPALCERHGLQFGVPAADG